MRPCLHALLHMASETVQVGPVPLTSTWPMERAVGFLGLQIKQPSDPYHNLSEQGVRQCQTNSLLSAYPQLERKKAALPQYSEPLGGGYILLHALERTPRRHEGSVGQVLREYFIAEELAAGNEAPADWLGPRIRRWARLQLPNGQIARCAWKECSKPHEKVRQSRMVKVWI